MIEKASQKRKQVKKMHDRKSKLEEKAGSLQLEKAWIAMC